MQKIEFVSARFEFGLARQARIEAARRNISRSELLRQAVTEFLRALENDEYQQKGIQKNVQRGS